MKYIVDIDGTICYTDNSDYANSKPMQYRIEMVNELYNRGNEIHYWTARGANSGKDWSELTAKQLKEWGCKYHFLRCDKPAYDLFIDDKCMIAREYFGVDLK